MEYTKDMFLNIILKKERNYNKQKKTIGNIIKNNKFIIIILTLLSVLIIMDIVLVNSFLELLSRL